MSDKQETILDKPLGGLSLMILLTAVWTLVGGLYINGHDSYILISLFTALILFFIYSYVQLNSKKKELPFIQIEEDKKKEKLYWIIFIAEGVGILIAKNILVNINRDNLFISVLALIVGLHFFPLAKVFNRKFDYYIGVWTTLTALMGITFTIKSLWTQELINAFVCFACAFATASYGLRMIIDAKKLYKSSKSY